MDVRFAFTRKHNGEAYEFYIVTPSYAGEKGCLGVEICPYVEVKTPENSFGYRDTILLHRVATFNNDGYFSGYAQKAYTLWRYLPPYILKAIEKQMLRLEETL